MLKLFRRQASGEFRTRSADRDRETDSATLGGVGKVIDEALSAMQAEIDGLSKRLSDARERASLAVGNDYDEHLTREPAMLRSLQKYEAQMRQATERLKVLEEDVGHLKFVRATFYSRFRRMNQSES